MKVSEAIHTNHCGNSEEDFIESYAGCDIYIYDCFGETKYCVRWSSKEPDYSTENFTLEHARKRAEEINETRKAFSKLIEKNIPVPKKRSKRWGKYWELVEQMEVNNSVLFKKHKEAERLRSYMKANKIPYAMRAVEGGWRVWKLETELKEETI